MPAAGQTVHVHSLDIAIIGYGTAGQSAAVLLARDGHRVRVFERAPVFGPVGSGFLLQPSGMEVLWQMGLLDSLLEWGRPIRRLTGDLESGRTVLDLRYERLGPGMFGLGVQRNAMFEVLHDAWRHDGVLQPGFEVASVDAEQGRLTSVDGRSEGPFDLVIVANGSHSKLRDSLGLTRAEQTFGWGALWCLVPEGDWPHRSVLAQRYRSATHMAGMLPVGGRPGDPAPQISFFWSMRGDALQAFDPRGFDAWKHETLRLWPALDAALAGVGCAADLFKARYRDVALGKTWHRGRCVLLGDVAHAMSPQLGQGVNMALCDARSLRDSLRTEAVLNTALQRYADDRRRHVAIYQFWSRWLTPLFQSESKLMAMARDLSLLPSSRLPWVGTHVHRVLAGTQHGVLGSVKLDPGFVRAMHERDGTL